MCNECARGAQDPDGHRYLREYFRSGVPPTAVYACAELGFKVSSQHPLVESQIVGHQAPRPVCSIRASCEAGH